MRTLLFATVVSAAFAFPALAQTQTQPAPRDAADPQHG